MSVIVRKATARDAEGWIDLLRRTYGSDGVAEQVYDLGRVAAQLTGPNVEETWVAEAEGQLRASISILGSGLPNANPVANLGRYVALPESYSDGSAEALVRGINSVCLERRQMAITRVAASDINQQVLLEQLGYVCVGFQPLKHLGMVREGVLFYLRMGQPEPAVRLPMSQSLPQIGELAGAVLRDLQVPNPPIVRDGLTGYPLQTELSIQECGVDSFDAAKIQGASEALPPEVSGYFNRGLGLLRVSGDAQLRMLLGQRFLRIAAGMSFFVDDRDKCVRVVESFAFDELSSGAMLQHVVRLTQEALNAVYLEVDFLMTAPRILKSAEQLGFVPVAYLPGFWNRDGVGVDLVKMVKLNASYTLDHVNLTPQARAMVDLVDRNFQDQKVGVAVIGLLRQLPAFAGLGDGELGKIARLFSQKLYRPGERVFEKGDYSNEAYVVMRGQIDIFLEDAVRPVGSVGNGAIFGEQAFLEGTPRSARAVAAQPSILLVVQRASFNTLIQTEPHLGMVIMRNMAVEVSNKLRKADAMIAARA
ncbi:MAG: cyclic nucleotide-binding domain-containing protein [Verrucomicrobiota bacterium]